MDCNNKNGNVLVDDKNEESAKKGAANKSASRKVCSSKKTAADFKRKYFDYYDDVKDHTKGKEDW